MNSTNTILKRCWQLRLLLGVPLATLILLSVPISPLHAQSPSSSGADSDGWQFTVAPYLMFPWMNGKAAVRGQDVEVDVGPSEIFDNLQLGGMGYFEARKGKWAVGVDAVYMALGATTEWTPVIGERANADVDFNQGAYTFMGMRQLNKKVDFLFGVRWSRLSGRLGLKGPQQTVLEDTKQWVDPIVGLMLKQRLGGPMHFTLEGDIGGFGIGSDFAWQLFPTIGADLNKHFAIKAGYRVLSLDYMSGQDKEMFKYDVITQAFVIGASFHF